MTRAVSIAAPPGDVWPWLAQLGRGAGWYSFDLLDNGRRASARHVVSWIPAPRVGDAAAIGYLHDLRPGESLTWWVPELRYFGSEVRLATDIRLRAEGDGSRLVIRISADATGPLGRVTLWVFRFIDSVMAIRQLVALRDRVERHGARSSDPERPESGDRAQFQLYEVIYASGEQAGVSGKEQAARWRRAAEAAVLPSAPRKPLG